MRKTFEAFQKEVRVTMFVLEQMRITFSTWFLLEIPFGIQAPASITDHTVAEKFRHHPFLALARELYGETVHTALDELQVIGVHVVTILIGPCMIFVLFNFLFGIRLWEFGVRELDEGGPIQDKYTQYNGLDIPATLLFAWLGSILAMAVIFPQTLSAVVYYLEARHWSYREVGKNVVPHLPPSQCSL